MPQICRICSHAERQAIDAVLLKGWPSLRIVGAQYGVSKDSLYRHYQSHIPDDGDEPRQVSEIAEHEKSTGSATNSESSTHKKEPDTVLKQGKTITQEEAEARYQAFIRRWRGQIGIGLADMAGWPEKGEDLMALVSEGIERGDLWFYEWLQWYCLTAQAIRRLSEQA